MSYTSNANLLTYSRLIIIPVIVVIYYMPFDWAKPISCILFVYASITDWVDGYLARKTNSVTLLGKFLDPVADKLLVTVCLFIICTQHNDWFIIVPSLLIISREIIVMALRELMARIGKDYAVAVSNLGKWKTAFQMVAIGCLIFDIWDLSFYVGIICLVIATSLTVWSMFEYLVKAIAIIMQADLMNNITKSKD